MDWTKHNAATLNTRFVAIIEVIFMLSDNFFLSVDDFDSSVFKRIGSWDMKLFKIFIMGLSSTSDDLSYFLLHRCCDIELKSSLPVNAKKLPIFWTNKNAACKWTRIFRIYIVLFLTIGKLFIYQHKCLSKLATDWSPNIWKPERTTNKYWN